ncbi:hypothetical protein D3C81_1276700 [compost metagenome]
MQAFIDQGTSGVQALVEGDGFLNGFLDHVAAVEAEQTDVAFLAAHFGAVLLDGQIDEGIDVAESDGLEVGQLAAELAGAVDQVAHQAVPFDVDGFDEGFGNQSTLRILTETGGDGGAGLLLCVHGVFLVKSGPFQFGDAGLGVAVGGSEGQDALALVNAPHAAVVADLQLWVIGCVHGLPPGLGG